LLGETRADTARRLQLSWKLPEEMLLEINTRFLNTSSEWGNLIAEIIPKMDETVISLSLNIKRE